MADRVERIKKLDEQLLAIKTQLEATVAAKAAMVTTIDTADTTPSVEEATVKETNSSVLHLDFSKMEFYDSRSDPEFPVDYLRKQLNVPDEVIDSYLAGSTRRVDKVYADYKRAYAMIVRALNSGWIKVVPDHIWRFCLMNGLGIDDRESEIRVYELMPGSGYGKVVITGDKHREKIIELASRGYYVTRRIDRRTSVPAGVPMDKQVTLITESMARFI